VHVAATPFKPTKGLGMAWSHRGTLALTGIVTLWPGVVKPGQLYAGNAPSGMMQLQLDQQPH
jgi:hypothetical protein